jgi:hypothetical protein
MQDTTLYPDDVTPQIVNRVRGWTSAMPHVEHAFEYHGLIAVSVSEDCTRGYEDMLIGMMLRRHLRLVREGDVHEGDSTGRWLYFADLQHRL